MESLRKAVTLASVLEISRAFVVPEPGPTLSGLLALATLAVVARRRHPGSS